MQRDQRRIYSKRAAFETKKTMPEDRKAPEFKLQYTPSSYFRIWANKSNLYDAGKPDEEGIYNLRETGAAIPNTYRTEFIEHYAKLFAMLVTVPVWEHARWRDNFYSCFSGAFTSNPNSKAGVRMAGQNTNKMSLDYYAANIICIQNVLNRASRRNPPTSADLCPFAETGYPCMQLIWAIIYQRYLQAYIKSIENDDVKCLKFHRIIYGKDKIEQASEGGCINPANLSCTNAHAFEENDIAVYDEAADRIIKRAIPYIEKFIYMISIGETNINRFDDNYPRYSKNKDFDAHLHFLVLGSIANVNDRMLLPIDPARQVKTEPYDQFRSVQKSMEFEPNLRKHTHYGNVYHYNVTFPYEKKQSASQLTSTLLDRVSGAANESMTEVHEKVDRHMHSGEERAASPIEFDTKIERGKAKRSMNEITRFTNMVTSNTVTPFSEANYKSKTSHKSKSKYVDSVLEESIPLVTENRQAVISVIKEKILSKNAEMTPLVYFSSQHQDVIEKILGDYDNKVSEARKEGAMAHSELHYAARRMPPRERGITPDEHFRLLGINGHIHTRYVSPMSYVHPILGERGVDDVISFAKLMKQDRVSSRDFFFDYNDVYFGFNDGTPITLAMIITKHANIVRNKHYINGLLAGFIIDLCTKWDGEPETFEDRFNFINEALQSHMARIVEAYEQKIIDEVYILIDHLFQGIMESNHRLAFNSANRIMALLETVTKYHKLA